MKKNSERMFDGGGKAIADAKKMLTIFVMVASLALVATLASVQTSSASCEVVKITSPTQGSNLNGVTLMKGYATYGGSTICAYLSGDNLAWYVNGKFVGTGKEKSFDFSPYNYCTGTYIKLKATIPTPSPHTISTTIWVKGPQPC